MNPHILHMLEDIFSLDMAEIRVVVLCQSLLILLFGIFRIMF